MKHMTYQLKCLFRSSLLWITIGIQLILVVYNFLDNVTECRGRDVLELFNPADYLLLGKMNMYGIWYLSLFPVIVTLSSSFIYLKDEESGIVNYKLTRYGSRQYGFCNMLSVGISNAIVFFIPLLIDLIINYITFSGYPSSERAAQGIYSEDFHLFVNSFLLGKLYVDNEVLYSFLHIVWIAFFAGCLAVFTYVLTLFIRFPFHVFYMIPVFLGLELSVLIQKSVAISSLQISYVDYLEMFQMTSYGMVEGLSICTTLLLFSVVITYWKFSGDCLV